MYCRKLVGLLVAGFAMMSLSVAKGQEQSRACCLPDDSCTDATLDECQAQGGASGATGTSCAAFNCGCDVDYGCSSACCFDDGNCFDSTAPDCVAAGGSPQSAGNTCGNFVCECTLPSEECAYRPCCLPDGSCAELPKDQCIVREGYPGTVGGTCQNFACGCPENPDGCLIACLFDDGSCENLLAFNCAVNHGDLQEPGCTCETLPCESCGDGECNEGAGETTCTCPTDCGTGSCGDDICCAAEGETTCNCADDCGSGSCGDGICCAAEGETTCNCADDCGSGSCGDGICCAAEGETTCNCADDCGSGSCGDGICCEAEGEACGNCSDDCGICECVAECGDGVCCSEKGETICNCTADCGGEDCDDNDVCTDDACDPVNGCSNTDNSARCNDNNVCTDDACDPVDGCSNTDNGARCDDQDACTDDYCDPQEGCVHEHNGTCNRPSGCRITGGRTVLDGVLVGDPDGIEMSRGQGGGQVGAPCGCIGCFTAHDPNDPMAFDHIQGNWQYSRKKKEGTFHAKRFNSLICGCDATSPTCDTGGVRGSGFADPNNFGGELCNPGNPVPGPEPRPSPANVACFSGIGDWTFSNGKKDTQVAFRVEVEDRGESAVGRNSDGTCDVFQIRIWIPRKGEDLKALADDVCCINGHDAIGTVRAPDIQDGGNLVHGNIQIHPELGHSLDGVCPVPNGVCQE